MSNDYIHNVFNPLSAEAEEIVTAEVFGDTSHGPDSCTLDKVLIDSGAIHYNYISKECVRRCKFKRFNLDKSINIHSIHNTEISTQYVYLTTALKYKEEKIGIENVKFIILDKSPYDIIIGLEAIRYYNLTTYLKTYFQAQENVRRILTPLVNTLSSGSAGNNVATDSEARPKPVPTQTRETPMLERVNSTIDVYPKDLFLDPADNADHIEILMVENPWSKYFNDTLVDRTSKDYPSDKSKGEPTWEFQIEGTEADKVTLKKLLEENRDIFATTVNATPAKVKPFSFEVDQVGWNTERANKARARLNSVAKDAAIEKFLKQAIADRVIAPSDAPAWSQVLLTPKPNGSWRFCLDYRMLNTYTRSKGWPIPNIQDVLAKIGSYNPKFFAVMDCVIDRREG